MESKEFRESIATSPNKDWYQNFSFLMNLPHLGYKKEIRGVSNLYEFLNEQVNGFEKMTPIPEVLNISKRRFLAAKNALIRLIKSGDISNHTWSNDLEGLKNNLTQIFPSDIPETQFLVKLNESQPQYMKPAFDYFTGNVNQVSSKTHLIGYLLAYEFSTNELSKIAERKGVEKRSIEKLKAGFETTIENYETQLIDFLTQANAKSVEFSKNIDTLKAQKEKFFDDWFSNTSLKYGEFNTNANSKITSLESLYREKLKLEAPAKYWSDRAKKLRAEGFWWLGGLIFSIIVGIVILIWALNEISVGTLDKIFQNAGTGIKWSVLFITLVSFIAFAIKIFSKLTFSSFHLVRDAEEREQLTYVYLALKNEKGIDETERHLIMQSLFSRADTGLLKEDGGPTMPGNIADKIISR